MPTPSSADKALNALLKGDNNYSLPSDRPSYLPSTNPSLTPTSSYSPTKFGKQLTIAQLIKQYDNLQLQLNSTLGSDQASSAYRANIQAQMNANIQARQQIGGNNLLITGITLSGLSAGAYSSAMNTSYMVNASNQSYINTTFTPKQVASSGILFAPTTRMSTSNVNANKVPPHSFGSTKAPSITSSVIRPKFNNSARWNTVNINPVNNNYIPSNAFKSTLLSQFNGNASLLTAILKCF